MKAWIRWIICLSFVWPAAWAQAKGPKVQEPQRVASQKPTKKTKKKWAKKPVKKAAKRKKPSKIKKIALPSKKLPEEAQRGIASEIPQAELESQTTVVQPDYP